MSTGIGRIESIDVLRGLVMIIMALDHVRIYFFAGTYLFSPTDLQHTTPAIFVTRLITHLCAPTFILLAGTSAYFIAQRKSKSEAAFFLFTRGLWLIALQLTLVHFAWHFDPAFHHITSNIISTIGFSMIFLSLLLHFNFKIILFIGALIVCGHNAFDSVSFAEGSLADMLWSFFHVAKLFPLANDYSLQFTYPLVPWIGVMTLGYCLGRLYDADFAPAVRRRALLWLGCGSLLLFVALRAINGYGDLYPWSHQETVTKTIMSFLKVEKYPPSLDFLCATLGVAMLLLRGLESKARDWMKPVSLFGNVALFYYVLHILVIHTLALIAVVAAGHPASTMIFKVSPGKASPLLVGKFGLTLPGTYALWIGVVVILYPACVYWHELKKRNKAKWWVSYV